MLLANTRYLGSELKLWHKLMGHASMSVLQSQEYQRSTRENWKLEANLLCFKDIQRKREAMLYFGKRKMLLELVERFP